MGFHCLAQGKIVAHLQEGGTMTKTSTGRSRHSSGIHYQSVLLGLSSFNCLSYPRRSEPDRIAPLRYRMFNHPANVHATKSTSGACKRTGEASR
eukprot:1016307-Amphidinium_carterae.1